MTAAVILIAALLLIAAGGSLWTAAYERGWRAGSRDTETYYRQERR